MVFRHLDLRRNHPALSAAEDTQTPESDETDAINALRLLAADAVEHAGSGNAGTAMALAPLAYRLYTRHLCHDPANPDWFDRDRVVLSSGHAAILLYGALHLAGYDISIKDLRSFRQSGSITPGHPDHRTTPGIDMSTGPLGQGVANGVGFAMAEKMQAARFNRPGLPVIDHRTWVIAGDGDMMEGISSEAASLAGRLGLAKLTIFYDKNRVSSEGASDIEFSENVPERFYAYGWQVLHVPCVNDLADIDAAIEAARSENQRPSLIVVGSNVGWGSPKQDSAGANGAPLGPEAIASTRNSLDWPHAPFEIPAAVYRHWRERVSKRVAHHAYRKALIDGYRSAKPKLAGELDRIIARDLPEDVQGVIPAFKAGERLSGRDASSLVMNALATVVPELVGGAADVAPSTRTEILDSGTVNSGDWTSNNIHFGVREHAMGAIVNAIAAHGSFRPFCATFLVFSDYLRPAIRMAALAKLPVIYVMTHDSIGVGEDGPTHQPIEHLASLRAIPGLLVIRPGDANEVAEAWLTALQYDGPTVLVLSRQDMIVLESDAGDHHRGAAVVAPGNDVTIVATGSEVEIALEARELLLNEDVSARVVSMSSWELFRDLPASTRDVMVPRHVPAISVEAGATQGWREFVDHPIGIDSFGTSASPRDLSERFGITAAAVASVAARALSPTSRTQPALAD